MQKIVFERRFEDKLRNGEIKQVTLQRNKYKAVKVNTNVLLYIEGLGKYAEATITKISYIKNERCNCTYDLPNRAELDSHDYYAQLEGYESYNDLETALKINQNEDTWILAFDTYYFRINKFI